MSQDYQYGDYNRGGMLAFSFSMAITMAFFVYVGFIHSGVDLKELKDNDASKKEQVVPETDVDEDSE